MARLTKNFDSSEFKCKCGACDSKISLAFVGRLQELRDRYGKPMAINSGVRCQEHNAAINGSRNSKHLAGIAADVAVSSSAEKYELIRLAMKMGFQGIGVGSSFVHIDDRKTGGRVWTY